MDRQKELDERVAKIGEVIESGSYERDRLSATDWQLWVAMMADRLTANNELMINAMAAMVVYAESGVEMSRSGVVGELNRLLDLEGRA